MIFLDRALLLIEKNNITKNKLLTDLELSKNSFVDWANRGNIPNGEVIIKISDYFNVSADYLLGRTNLSKKEENIETKENQIELLENFEKLNERGKEEALKRVHELTYINNYVEASKKFKTRPTMIAAYGGDGVMVERTTKEEDEKTLEIMKKMKFRKE